LGWWALCPSISHHGCRQSSITCAVNLENVARLFETCSRHHERTTYFSQACTLLLILSFVPKSYAVTAFRVHTVLIPLP
jgi:hypothetical protein